MARNKVPEQHRILKRDFVLICIAMLFSRMIMFMQSSVFPLYVIDVLNHPKSVAGLMNSAAAVASIIMRPFIGHMVDKGRTKVLFAIGAIVYTLSIFGSGLYTTIPLLILFRFTYGMGQSVQSTSGGAVATQLIPESRMREGLGYFGLTASISQAFGPTIALMLIAVIGYRNQFMTSTILMLCSFIMGMTVRMPKPKEPSPAEAGDGGDAEDEGGAERERWWHRIIEKTAINLSWMMFMTDIALVAISTFLLIRASELNIGSIGLFFTIQAVSVTCIRLFGAKLTRGKRERPALILTFAGLAAALIATFFAVKLWHFILIAAFYGLFTGNYYVTLQTMMIMNAPPHRRGLANSTYFMSFDIGAAIGAPLWGLLADVIGTRSIFPLAAVFPLFAMVVFILRVPKPAQNL